MAELFDILNYNTTKNTYLSIPDTMTEVVTLTTPVLPAGTYEIGYSFSLDFNGQKNKSCFYRIDGTYGDSIEHSLTAEANADHKNKYYLFPKVFAGGVITLAVSMRKDPGITKMDVDFIDVMVRRVA